jgi:hypothetical protein
MLALEALSGLGAGIALVVTLAIFFPSVSPDAADTAKVWMAFTPNQCDRQPWDGIKIVYPPESRPGVAAHNAAKASFHFQGHGIVVYDAEGESNRIVPAACGFPESYDILLQVPQEQALRMMLFGFKPHDSH